MFNEYAMSVEARQHLAELRREAESDRVASACRKAARRHKATGKAPPLSSAVPRRWRARLAWLLGY